MIQKERMNTQAPAPWILIDGSYLMFASFFALPNLSNKEGLPTGAILGVRNVLQKLEKQYPDAPFIVAFDTKVASFRKDLFPAYKANRLEMPSELSLQIPWIHEMVKALGHTLLLREGAEADDLLGTLAKRREAEGLFSYIASADKDFSQLVSARTHLIHPFTMDILDVEGVRQKFGVHPSQIRDFLALTGDSSDNIPGIPKVGPKTAALWLATYPDIETLLSHQDEVKGALGERLRENALLLPLYKQLTTIQTDLSIELTSPPLGREHRNTARLSALYEMLNFKKDALPQSQTPQSLEFPKDPLIEDLCVTAPSGLESLLRSLENESRIALLPQLQDERIAPFPLVGLTLATTKRAYYLPLFHDVISAPEQLRKEDLIPLFSALSGKSLITHTLTTTLHTLKALNQPPRAFQFEDVALLQYLLDATRGTDLSAMMSSQNLPPPQESKLAPEKQSPSETLLSSGPKARALLSLESNLKPLLLETPTLAKLYETLELPLAFVLFEMEDLGIAMDLGALKTQSNLLEKRIHALQEEAQSLVSQAVNLNSPKQLEHLLFEVLTLQSKKKTQTGQRSTSESALEALEDTHPIIPLILEYRRLTKLQSTYLLALPRATYQGRIHTHFNQTVAVTGRLSSSGPNLQNIPVRSEEGRMVRQGFVASEGHQLVSLDYSQIELRIMAHVSNDPLLIADFKAGKDIHAATAAQIFGKPLEAVSAEERRQAKAVNFGLMYGMGPQKLAQDMGLSLEEAKAFIQSYFKHYPHIKFYMESARELAKERGYTETLEGRRLPLPDLQSASPMKRAFAERVAINAPLQGTAADIIKRAMIQIQSELLQNPGLGRMLLSVHDEIVIESERPKEAAEVLIPLMRSALTLSVPLEVNAGFGKNWAEAH